jgi:hypothetical protein
MTRTAKQVEMIGHQGPGETGCPGIQQNIAQTMKKVIPVGVNIEYLLPFDAASHDVVDGISGIYACSSWHEIHIGLI